MLVILLMTVGVFWSCLEVRETCKQEANELCVAYGC